LSFKRGRVPEEPIGSVQVAELFYFSSKPTLEKIDSFWSSSAKALEKWLSKDDEPERTEVDGLGRAKRVGGI